MQTCGTYHTENLQRTFLLCIGFSLVELHIIIHRSNSACAPEEVVHGHVNRVKITLAKFRC